MCPIPTSKFGLVAPALSKKLIKNSSQKKESDLYTWDCPKYLSAERIFKSF